MSDTHHAAPGPWTRFWEAIHAADADLQAHRQAAQADRLEHEQK